MAYSICKAGHVNGSADPILVHTTPIRHMAMVTVRLLPIVPLDSGQTVTADVYVRTAGGADDMPIALGLRVAPGVPCELKAVYIHGNQTLVIKPYGNMDWCVDGYGDASPTSEDLPQGRMFSGSGWKASGSPFIIIDIPDARKRLTNAVEADFFINGRVIQNVRVDVKVSNSIVDSDTAFNSTVNTAWLFTTMLKPDIPTRIFRKITFGYRYIVLKVYDDAAISAFVQYNLRDHNLL